MKNILYFAVLLLFSCNPCDKNKKIVAELIKNKKKLPELLANDLMVYDTNVILNKNEYIKKMNVSGSFNGKKIIDTLYCVGDTVFLSFTYISDIHKIINFKYLGNSKYKITNGKVSFIEIYLSESQAKNNMKWSDFYFWILKNNRKEAESLNEKLDNNDSTYKEILKKQYQLYTEAQKLENKNP